MDDAVPTVQQARHYLLEAAALNPGSWVRYVEYVALAARAIAEHDPRVDPARAYVLGLLHDIGRRTGGPIEDAMGVVEKLIEVGDGALTGL